MADQRILILGAGGTVGSWALQWAARSGAEVIATASGEDLDWVRRHGAVHVLDHHAEAFEQLGSDFDAVIDPVPGPDVALRALRNLKPQGRLLVCAAPVNALRSADTADRHIQFVSYLDTAEQLSYIARSIDNDQMDVRVGEVLPLDRAADAHRMLDGAPHQPGKIVLCVA
jgi:NADPH:quinone reductase-like Zn-dependent oxidoreductase